MLLLALKKINLAPQVLHDGGQPNLQKASGLRVKFFEGEVYKQAFKLLHCVGLVVLLKFGLPQLDSIHCCLPLMLVLRARGAMV